MKKDIVKIKKHVESAYLYDSDKGTWECKNCGSNKLKKITLEKKIRMTPDISVTDYKPKPTLRFEETKIYQCKNCGVEGAKLAEIAISEILEEKRDFEERMGYFYNYEGYSQRGKKILSEEEKKAHAELAKSFCRNPQNEIHVVLHQSDTSLLGGFYPGI